MREISKWDDVPFVIAAYRPELRAEVEAALEGLPHGFGNGFDGKEHEPIVLLPFEHVEDVLGLPAFAGQRYVLELEGRDPRAGSRRAWLVARRPDGRFGRRVRALGPMRCLGPSEPDDAKPWTWLAGYYWRAGE